MDNIYLGTTLVAIRIRRFAEGTAPMTAPEEALQLLTLKYPEGHDIKPHRHRPRKRVTAVLQECLLVIRGKIRVDLYDETGTCFRKIVARAGQAVVLLGVAHGVRFLESSRGYELKTGPFIDDKEFL